MAFVFEDETDTKPETLGRFTFEDQQETGTRQAKRFAFEDEGEEQQPPSGILDVVKNEFNQGISSLIEGGQRIFQEERDDFSFVEALKGTGQAALGGFQAAFAPITGIERSIFQPIFRKGLDAAGVPENIAEPASGIMAAIPSFFIPIGGLARGVTLGAAKLGKVTQLGKVAKVAKETIEELPSFVKASGIKVPKGKETFLRQLDRMVKSDEVQFDQIPQILINEGFAALDATKIYINIPKGTFFGEGLNVLSQGKRQMAAQLNDVIKKAVPGSKEAKEAKKALKLLEKSKTGLTPLGRLENVRRAGLVSGIGTAVRNAISQTGRLVIGAVDDGLQGFIRGGKADISDAAASSTSFFNRLNKSGRKRVEDILDADPRAKEQLLGQTIQEVSLTNEVLKKFNFLNIKQETFFRKVNFEAGLRVELRKIGKNFDTINPNEIPKGLLEKVVRRSLERTFAADPKTAWGRNFLKAYKTVGGTLINPFPRFTFANAIPFIADHSPLGYAKLFQPKVWKKLVQGDADDFSRIMSQATIGLTMMESAFHIRQSEFAGLNPFDIIVGKDAEGNNIINRLAAFNPLAMPLLFAEAVIRPGTVSFRDFSEALIGLNRIRGTGLVLFDGLGDLLRGGGSKKMAYRTFKDFAAQYAGSFVPGIVKSAADITESVRGGANKPADTRRSILTPTLKRLPFIGGNLPKRTFPTQTEFQSSTQARLFGEPGTALGKLGVATTLSQITGASLRSVNDVENELDKIGFNFGRTLPNTGNPDADEIVAKEMQRNLVPRVRALIGTSRYKRFGKEAKKEAIGTIINSLRRRGMGVLARTNNRLFQQIKTRKLSPLEKEKQLRLQQILTPAQITRLKEAGRFLEE